MVETFSHNCKDEGSNPIGVNMLCPCSFHPGVKKKKKILVWV